MFGNSNRRSGGLSGTRSTRHRGFFGRNKNRGIMSGSTTSNGQGGLFGGQGTATSTGGILSGSSTSNGQGGLFGGQGASTTTTGSRGGLFGRRNGMSSSRTSNGNGMFGSRRSGGGLFGNRTSSGTSRNSRPKRGARDALLAGAGLGVVAEEHHHHKVQRQRAARTGGAQAGTGRRGVFNRRNASATNTRRRGMFGRRAAPVAATGAGAGAYAAGNGANTTGGTMGPTGPATGPGATPSRGEAMMLSTAGHMNGFFGTVLCSPALKAKGFAEEQQANAMRMQVGELSAANDLEAEARDRRAAALNGDVGHLDGNGVRAV